MTAYVIRTGIPIPKRAGGRRPRGPAVETVGRLEVDQCVALPGASRKFGNSIIYRAGKYWPGRKFTQRTTATGVTIWRTA